MTDTFATTIQNAYTETKQAFMSWSALESYRRLVCPPAVSPDPGFAIFYTAPRYKPDLAIVGQNPSNFAGRGPWTAEPNRTMLSGSIPNRNSYQEDKHFFAEALGSLFAGHETLLAEAVGLNVWHFQASSSEAREAPKDLMAFCEATTLSIVRAMQPKAIICFGRPAFCTLTGRSSGHHVAGTLRGEWLDVDGSRVWFVYHPSASWARNVAVHDTPLVVAEVAAYIRQRS